MLYYKATAGCGVGGLWSRCASAPPRVSHPGSCSGVAAPYVARPRPCATRSTLTGPIRITSAYLVPLSRPPVCHPPRTVSVPYTYPFFFAALFVWASHHTRPPCSLQSPRLALASPFLHALPSHLLSSQGPPTLFPAAALPHPWLHCPRPLCRCCCRRRLLRCGLRRGASVPPSTSHTAMSYCRSMSDSCSVRMLSPSLPPCMCPVDLPSHSHHMIM